MWEDLHCITKNIELLRLRFSVPAAQPAAWGFGMFAVVVGYAEKLKRNSVRMARVVLEQGRNR